VPVLRTSVDAPKAAAPRDIEWRDAAVMFMEGRGWTEPGRAFHRLPARAEGKVTDAVWGLEKNTAGLAVPFITDSPSVHVRWSGGGAMPHMPATGMSGVDLYERQPDGWRFVANGRPKDGETTRTLTSAVTARTEYLLYLPLYQKVDYLEIGVEKGATFSQPIQSDRKPIIFYGTSIVQGGCASRPGMAHVAIIGRQLDWPVMNLGFSGSARMEPAMADLVGELDAAVYVLDCLPNMTDDLIPDRVEAFIRRLRELRPDTPIIMVEHLKPEKVLDRNARYQELYRKLTAEGMVGLHLLPGETLLAGKEEGTVDGTHPTDLGFYFMAEAHLPILRKILHLPED
jgi:lysophospholipase L1-like esterase